MGLSRAALREARKINKTLLADYVWREAVELPHLRQRWGGALWMCPYGCHTVKC